MKCNLLPSPLLHFELLFTSFLFLPSEWDGDSEFGEITVWSNLTGSPVEAHSVHCSRPAWASSFLLACGHRHTESTALQKLEDTACRRRAELTTSPEIVISLLLSQPIYKNTLLGLSLSGCFWANVSNVFNCSPVCGSGESCHAQ